MCTKVKTLIGVLLLCIAAILPFSLTYVEAGSASASDFQMKGSTLVKYTGTAKAVSIPTSVKSIGEEAFAGHTELVKVVIPGYVESIGYNAFTGCTSLETVTVPDTVVEIGNGAFSGCTALKSVKLGRELEKIGTGIFAECDALSTVSISSRNEHFVYDKGVIYSKDKTIIHLMLPGYETANYSMPSTVETIDSNAFWGCQNLKKVEIGSNVEKIPDYAFSNCPNLEKVVFPYSLRSIGLKAFADCQKLGEIELPMSVSYIHDTAFDGCPQLKIVAEAGSKAAEFEANRDKTPAVSSKFDDILPAEEEEAVSETTEEDTSAGTGAAASGGRLLGQTRIVGRNAVVLMDGSSGVLSGNPIAEQQSSVPVVETSKQEAFSKYTIVDDEKIVAQAYYNNKGLKEYEIPGTIKELGDFSFARSGLTSIAIPDGVTSIGYGAFYHCDDLGDVTIPSSVTEIGPSAFAHTKWLEESMKNRTEPFIIVGDGILIAYSGLASKIEIPDGVKQIGAGAFKGNTRISSVTFPDSLTIIGEDAFAGCRSLTSISGGNQLIQIKDRAFQGCPVSTVKIPASVQSIGLKAFDISGSGKKDSEKVAVFLGKDLPVMSYEQTATRMENADYRESVFKDVHIAVVDDSITAGDIRGTVLDYDSAGFRGFICSVEKTPAGENPGILRLKYCSILKRNMTSGTIPEEVIVYGKTYQVSVPEGDLTYLSGVGSSQEKGTVQVVVDSTTLPASPAVTAELTESKENYILNISDNSADGGKISSAYKRAIAGGKIYSLQVYDIELVEERTMIPISIMGRQKLTITLPKPRGIAAQRLQVVYMDGDGQLEEVEARTVTVDGTACVQFEAGSTGIYGIYN